MTTVPDDTALLDQALALIAERGFAELSLSALARAAGVPLARVYQVFPDKPAILKALIERVDLQVLSGEAPDALEAPRDRLFDILMRRFDALAPYRDPLRVIYHDLRRRPLEALAVSPILVRSMEWALDAADFSRSGPFASLRAPALAAVYGSVLPVWLDDDADLAKTMAALDRRLRRLEDFMRGRSPSAPPDETDAAQSAPDA